MSKIQRRNLRISEINQMLFFCLNDLKIYEVICYTIIKVGCVTKRLASFSWTTLLVLLWWCHSKKANFTFIFYNNMRTRRHSMLAAIFWCVETMCFSTHSPNLRKCKWDNFFSHCIVFTACLCLHEAVCFMTFMIAWFYIVSHTLLKYQYNWSCCKFATNIFIDCNSKTSLDTSFVVLKYDI